MLAKPDVGQRSAAVRALPPGVLSVGIVYLGTRPSLSFPGDEILSHDKLMHALAFGLLSTLTYRWVSHARPRIGRAHAALVAVAYATTLGAVLELIQATLPYRSMEFADLVADTIGAAASTLAAVRARLERDLTRWRI